MEKVVIFVGGFVVGFLAGYLFGRFSGGTLFNKDEHNVYKPKNKE